MLMYANVCQYWLGLIWDNMGIAMVIVGITMGSLVLYGIGTELIKYI